MNWKELILLIKNENNKYTNVFWDVHTRSLRIVLCTSIALYMNPNGVYEDPVIYN